VSFFTEAVGAGPRKHMDILGLGMADGAELRIHPTGTAVLRISVQTQGQGHETTFAQIVSDRLGIPVEKISVVKGDTDTVPRGTGTYGSKSTQIGGAAAGQASEQLVERAKELAAAELEASPADMQFDVEAGSFHVAGAPEPALAWWELSQRLHEQGRLDALSVETDFTAEQPTFPFGAHLAVVEVDTETGAVELKRMVAVDDAGRIINPLVAEGQVHGGVVAGIAQALYEELTFDDDGNPQNANLVTYAIPAASELPPIEVVGMETPTPINPLGVKGIGESGTIGATPAVHNAVIDALSPYGVRHIDMPVNGESVWRAIHDSGRN
jgi:carbon-monoxide dehydrogenase large subunit